MTTDTEQGISDEEALAIFESGEGFDVEHAENTPLGNIWVAREAYEAVEALLDAAVLAGRASGLSWDQISVALGMTRQGARQHYMPLALPADEVLAVPHLDIPTLTALKDLNTLLASLRDCGFPARGPREVARAARKGKRRG